MDNARQTCLKSIITWVRPLSRTLKVWRQKLVRTNGRIFIRHVTLRRSLFEHCAYWLPNQAWLSANQILYHSWRMLYFRLQVCFAVHGCPVMSRQKQHEYEEHCDHQCILLYFKHGLRLSINVTAEPTVVGVHLMPIAHDCSYGPSQYRMCSRWRHLSSCGYMVIMCTFT